MSKETKLTTTPTGLKWRVLGGESGGYLEVFLGKGETVIGAGGAMLYIKGSVSLPQTKAHGFFGRLLAGEELFINSFEGLSDKKDGCVAFGQSLPGGVIGIPLSPGQGVKLSRGSFLACTSNVKVTGKFNWRGLIPIGQQEGVFLTKAVCDPGTKGGMVWISTYASLTKHVLEAGETMILDNGVFLACDVNNNYKIVRIGKTLASVIFGGEAFGMEFTGPATIYTQSRSTEALISTIAASLPDKSEGAKIQINGGVRRIKSKTKSSF